MPVRHSRVTRPSRAVPPAAALAFLADAFAGLLTSVLFNCGMGTCSEHAICGPEQPQSSKATNQTE